MSETALQRVDTGASSRALAPSQLTDDQVTLIKQTVAKGASDNELQLFLHLAQTYGLDPFAKEIWCIKYGNNPATIFTSRDGYLKIANGHPAFDGIAGDVVYRADTFEVVSGDVRHTYAAGDRGPILGAYAQVFRRDRRVPAYVFAPFAEYNAGKNPTWRNYPSAMILKVAEAMALKRAFSISGLVTREELAASDDEAPAPPRPPRRRGGGTRQGERHPSEMLYDGPTEAEVERARQSKPAPVVEDAEAEEVDDVDPDELTKKLDERLATIDSADKPTVKRWFEEARDDWPEPLRSRLMDACHAQAGRFA